MGKRKQKLGKEFGLLAGYTVTYGVNKINKKSKKDMKMKSKLGK